MSGKASSGFRGWTEYKVCRGEPSASQASSLSFFRSPWRQVSYLGTVSLIQSIDRICFSPEPEICIGKYTSHNRQNRSQNLPNHWILSIPFPRYPIANVQWILCHFPSFLNNKRMQSIHRQIAGLCRYIFVTILILKLPCRKSEQAISLIFYKSSPFLDACG